MTSPKIVIVTGANRGIGLAICKRILNDPGLPSLTLFAASRAGTNLNLSPSSSRSVQYPRLDISDSSSVHALAKEVSQHGKVDVLINNAGINLDQQYGFENAKKTIDVNYRATANMCRVFLPLLTPSTGRIVNLSSTASSLQHYSSEIQSRFRSSTSASDLDNLASEFLDSVKGGNEVQAGFGSPRRAYSVSKGLLNGITAVLAKENSNAFVNACCPGWVQTDMGSIMGTPFKTPEDGASIPLRLAFGDINNTSGKYWANDSIRGKGDGQVQAW